MATSAGHTAKSPVNEVITEFMPLDVAILKMLPVEGSTLGYSHLGIQVTDLTKQLNKNVPVEHRVTADRVSGRTKTLELLGLVTRVTVQPAQKGKGLQITPRGQEALKLADNTTGE
jgi:hypothetical protein